MNRPLQLLNLLGIVILMGLCGVQWFHDSALQRAQLSAEQTAQHQTATIARQQQAMVADRADLDDFRTRLAAAVAHVGQINAKLHSAEAERSQAVAARDQLQSTCKALAAVVAQWKAAVAARDVTLKSVAAAATQAAGDRNDAIARYNALATQYNAANAELKKAADTIQIIIAQRNDAVAKFNSLAAKYNALVAGSNSSTTTQP